MRKLCLFAAAAILLATPALADDDTLTIGRIAAIDEGAADALTFATTPAYLEAALKSRAGAVLVDESLLSPERKKNPEKPLIAVASAREALATLLQAFEPPRKRGPFRHPSAVVDERATVGSDVYIGPGVTVSAGAHVGARRARLVGVAAARRPRVSGLLQLVHAGR